MSTAAGAERDFYVTMRRGNRVAWLGPFATHAEALERVKDASAEAERCDPRSWFDAFGTCSLPRAPANPRGVLNARLARLGILPLASSSRHIT